jgi:hypothetical protein
MNISNIIFYLSIIFVGFGVKKYKTTFDKNKNTITLQESLPWFGSLGILSAFRHIIYNGSLGKKYGGIWEKQGKIFEYNDGIANLAFGIICFNAIDKNIEVQKSAILSYAIYLFGSMFVHVYALHNDKKNSSYKIGTIIYLLTTTLIMFQISIFS